MQRSPTCTPIAPALAFPARLGCAARVLAVDVAQELQELARLAVGRRRSRRRRR